MDQEGFQITQLMDSMIADGNSFKFSRQRYERVEMSKSIPEGMGWRVGITILTFFGSVIGVIVWLFFYADDFSVYQNIAIVVVIFLGFVTVMGAIWAPWGMRQGTRLSEKGH
jgi:hypothetical protein